MSWSHDTTRIIRSDILQTYPDGHQTSDLPIGDLDRREQLDALADFAYTKMSSSPKLGWRRLYTDVCLLRTLADVDACSSLDQNTAMQCIARLDRAIILSGAPGLHRLDLILSIIRHIQAQHLPPPLPNPFHPPTSPRPPAQHLQLETSSNCVPHLDNPPSLSSFQRAFSQHPFILRGYARDWPAMQERPWSSVDYLRSVAGPGRIVPVEVGKDYRNDDWTQKLMNWDEFLESIDFPDRPSRQTPGDVLYLAQHNLLTQFPALRADIVIPDYLYACPSCPVDFPAYKPPANEEQFVLNAWLGPKGTISPAHTDPYFNFYVQVVGRKTVWLAPPRVSSSMYPYPASNADQSINPAANTLNQSMSNTSRVDVFPSSTNAQEACRREYPDFWVHVVPDTIHTTLEPGDVLFFPPGWWHAMRSEEASFSVSMWF